MAHIEVRTGAATCTPACTAAASLNALHVLHRMIAQVMPGPDGALRDELRAGIAPPAGGRADRWERLKPGDEVISEVGGRRPTPDAAGEYYDRNGADASFDVNEFVGGEPRTVVPSTAKAHGLAAPRARPAADEIGAELRAADARGGARGRRRRASSWHLAEPVAVRAGPAGALLAAEAVERATGMAPALVRTGGSIPVVAEFAARGIPTIVSGFALPDDDIHAPERVLPRREPRARRGGARELYRALARLPR